jgi:hypothetical protein
MLCSEMNWTPFQEWAPSLFQRERVPPEAAGEGCGLAEKAQTSTLL